MHNGIIEMEFVLNNNKMNYTNIMRCIDNLLTFHPVSTSMFGDYSEEQVENYIRRELENNERFFIILSEDSGLKNSLAISRGRNYTSFVGRSTIDNFKKSDIIEALTRLFGSIGGFYAYIVSAVDNYWQNNEDISLYEINNKPLDNIKIISRPKMKDDWIVDINQFPGHSHGYKGVWFGSCWMMWFGEEYYQYVDKGKLETFKDCDENIIISDVNRRIKLYNNPLEYDLDENRRRQWAFRNYVGMDDMAKKFMGQ